MGMYTQLVLAAELKKNVPTKVSQILMYMTGDERRSMGFTADELPGHELFDTDRWHTMLRMDSYYFDGDTHSEIRYDDIAKQYVLTIRCNLKNYGNEIALFLDWLGPYVDSYDGTFHGYTIYEEDTDPTLIYFKGPGSFETREV